MPLAAALLAAAPARAADAPPPTVSAAARETLDVWDVASGGLRQGVVLLNKLQVSATIAGDSFGLPGLSIHAQLFRADGRSLSARVGDVQTVDSIDTRPVTRLFESWIEQKLGDDQRSLALRFGLIDLNADFDSVQTASLFVNSSQGIGADLARSGRNGPSIYPVSALALRLSWLPSRRWTFRLGAFDGVPGDPLHPKAFVRVKLGRGDGALVIAQADYHLSDDARIEAGAWRYTAGVSPVAGASAARARDQGLYASIEGPLPGVHKWSAWLRAGIADARAQTIGGYLGCGVVGRGVIAGRPDDRLGFAIARAAVGAAARRSSGLPRAETSFEGTYQLKIGDTLAVQPDVQYVLHPAQVPHTRSALVLGLRFVASAGYPKQAPAADATDPTVPPEGP